MKNNTEQHYYDILGIKKGSGLKKIKNAFYERTKELHSDINDEDTLMNRRFQLLIEAYEELKKIIEERNERRSNAEVTSSKEYFLKLKLRPNLMAKGGEERIEYKEGEFIHIVIPSGVIDGQILSYTRSHDNDKVFFEVEELPKETIREKFLRYKEYYIMMAIVIGLFILLFPLIRDEYLENQRKITVKAIILDKIYSENNSYIIYKNTENNIFKIPNAMKFWDCGKVGDSILVSFKNENSPVFLDVKPLK